MFILSCLVKYYKHFDKNRELNNEHLCIALNVIKWQCCAYLLQRILSWIYKHNAAGEPLCPTLDPIPDSHGDDLHYPLSVYISKPGFKRLLFIMRNFNIFLVGLKTFYSNVTPHVYFLLIYKWFYFFAKAAYFRDFCYWCIQNFFVHFNHWRGLDHNFWFICWGTLFLGSVDREKCNCMELNAKITKPEDKNCMQ